MTELDLAFEIAVRDLRACYDKEGIFAGRGHFQEYWARDSFFACMGANALKDFEIVEKNLELFLKYQHKSGQIPYKISKKMQPAYWFLLSEVIDSNSLFLIALNDFLKKSENSKFVEKNFEKILKAIQWLEKQDKDRDGLVEEGVFANWSDSVMKFGKVLYSNCCYYKALVSFSEICNSIDKIELANSFSEKAIKTKTAINRIFWNYSYYLDWIDYAREDFFSSDGNILAIIWNIADQMQGEMIENKIKQHQLNKFSITTNFPAYPFWRVPMILLPFKAYHYHNGFSWQWLGCFNVIALKKIGFSDDAKKELKKIAIQILEHNSTHEIFDENGKPVDSFLLKSEHPFAWSAAAYILAYNNLKK